MKKEFNFALRGADWWRPFLLYWVIFLALDIPLNTVRRWAPPEQDPGTYFPIVFVLTLATVLVQAVFTIVVFRIVLPAVSIDGKSFAFRGAVGRYLGINLGGILLTMITVTIYAPWYARRAAAYLVSETSFDGDAPEFLGKGGKLFVYLLLGLWVPVLVVAAVAGLLYGFTPRERFGTSETMPGVTAVVTGIMFIIFIPFMYLAYRWYINYRYREFVVRWRTRFWPSVGFMLGQIALTAVTAGIYWPAAMLRLYRYFLGKTVVSVGEEEIGRLGFDGSIGKGFGLIWGQTLLSAITLGIYIPWAFSKVGRWVLGASWYERSEAAV